MILVLNVGSSSVKCKIFDGQKEIYSTNFENISTPKKRLQCIEKISKYIKQNNYTITKVGHRIVHGKEINQPVKLTPANIKKINKISELAPLHVRAELDAVSHAKKEFKVDHYAVFDTAFHSTIPLENKIYAIPYKYYKQGIHKYGFHGISHKYITQSEPGKVISAHLGSGCSLAAIKDNKSIDTTMGFTPLEGLVMSTRAGSIDPGLFSYLSHKEKLTNEQLTDLFNKKSGLLGLSAQTSDMKTLLESTDTNAKLAVDVFVNSVAKHIMMMTTSLQGLDTLIFTGGIGEKSAPIRTKVLDKLHYFGIRYSQKKNQENKQEIHTSASKIKIKIKPTNEELQIANEIR